MPEPIRMTRGQAIALGSAGLAGGLLSANAAQAESGIPAVDTGIASSGRVRFPDWTASSDPAQEQPPALAALDERIGFAVVGLGKLALENILPAFGKTNRARLVALVSGSPEKARTIAAQYGIASQAVYDYANFDAIRSNPTIQVVYIVLPNAMHREYVVRAARAGKHVLCEKPMATSVEECTDMVAACRQASRRLMIAYRCQYDLVNRDLLRTVRDQTYGAARFIEASNLQDMADPRQWRLKKSMAGGGSLYDVGIYCLNAARFLTGEEPVEVFGRTQSTAGDPRFTQVEETTSFTLRFPGGVIANCASSYGMHQSRTLVVHTTRGALTLENAFAYDGARLLVAHRDGDVETVTERKVMQKDQFALELDHMAECVATGRAPHTGGEEGLQDQRVMDAIYRSAKTGKPVAMAAWKGKLDATRGPALM